jgi:hypothetical protein
MKIGDLRMLLDHANSLEKEIHEQETNKYYPRRKKKRELRELDNTEVGVIDDE